MSIFSHQYRASSKRGFTLIELLVVISIMMIISAVLLFRQQQFNSSTVLRSLGYSVALSIHQAQVYGISIKQDTSGQFAPAYGIYFNANNPSQYILFADVGGTGQYTGSSENVQVFTLNQGYTVKNICGGSTDCSGSGSITWMTIMFRRPNPEACIATSIHPTACAISGGTPAYASAYVQLSSQGGSTRGITVSSTGEISVSNSAGS